MHGRRCYYVAAVATNIEPCAKFSSRVADRRAAAAIINMPSAAAGLHGLAAASSAPEQTTAATATAVGAARHVEGPANAAARSGAVAAVGSAPLAAVPT